MYADKMTDSMKMAIDETNRRRAKQKRYNEEHGIQPVSIHKTIRDITERLTVSGQQSIAEKRGDYQPDRKTTLMPRGEMQRLVAEMERQMKQAAKDMEFEKAAALRDQMFELRAMMVEDSNLSPLQKIKILSGEE